MKFSKSEQKLINYIDEFIETDDCQRKINGIRKELEIPETGLVLNGVSNNLKNLTNYILGDILHEIGAPKLKILNLSMNELLKSFPILDGAISNFFRIYILFNKKEYKLFNEGLDITGLCKVEDINEFISEWQFIAPPDKALEIIKKNFISYPVVIKLNPAISQRALISFIKEHWEIIEVYLKLNRTKETKLGKIKKKNENISKRDEFIYQNRDKSGKELGRLVKEQFGESLPYEYILKIKSREIKRRQKV